MSFNRLRYDECATKLHNERSIGMGDYRLFPGYSKITNSNIITYD